MIMAVFKKGELLLEISGHAEYSPGDDIVCAGVSAIIGTLASFLGVRKSPCEVILKKGYALISSRDEKDAPLFDLSAHGLYLISLEYPENVSFKTI